MGVLESVLNQKRFEQEQRRADMNALSQGIQYMGESKQRQQVIDLKRMETQATLNELMNKKTERENKTKFLDDMVSRGAKPTKATIDGITLETPEAKQSPSAQIFKDKKAAEIFDMVEQNNVQRSSISDAMEATKNIQGGVYGKISRETMKNIDPNNPILGDWQKIKMVLLDAQLMKSALLKGAISDWEGKQLAAAAANDDVASLPAMIPVFNRVLKSINANEKAKVEFYKKRYNDNPYDWEGIQSNINDVKEMQFDNSPKSKKYTIGDVINRGKKSYKIVGFDKDGEPLVE